MSSDHFEDYDSYEEGPRRYSRWIRLLLIWIVFLFVIWAVGGQLIWFWLNVMEFGDLFIRPIYFEILGGLVLATIALVRLDFKNRRSLTWWLIRLGLRLIRERGMIEAIPPSYTDFKSFKLTPVNFVLWQATKVLVGMVFFMNLTFGMSLYAMMQGWDPGLNQIWGIFRLPFITPPFDMSYSEANVIPLIPSLTLIVPPILGALGIRLIILVGITHLAFYSNLLLRLLLLPFRRMGVSIDRAEITRFITLLEALAALAAFWMLINSFFPSFIDYNTRYVIAGLAATGILFTIFALLDRLKGKGLSLLTRRRIFLRVAAIIIIILITSSIIVVNHSIADARKGEWRGPYTAQQIAVNRYLAELDGVRELPYNFSIKVIPIEQISAYASEQRDLLNNIRLWDWDAAFAKLKPEIGLIPYIDFEDSDILRFNNTLYWSASMAPILPATVRPEDHWYATHLYYTHVPSGFLILDAYKGEIVDTAQFFKQRKIYYGEGGLLEEAWVAYPVGRERSDELGGAFYTGNGGLDVPPPLSWFFDMNFFWSYRDSVMHIIRFRDVYDRMQLLFPYFEYKFNGEFVDMLPVTDGENTYWLMPLIVRLDTKNVPWSGGNPIMRLVGYSLIDIYNGSIQLLITGNDYFSELFKVVYSDYVTTEVPEWLKNQLRYPEELFEWRVSMYNYFHVTDPITFLVGKEFFEVPEGLDTYYIIAKPPDFEATEFVGLLSLELRGALGRNLAGYMIVRNDYENFGEMNFYKVPLEAETKLLGPTAVLEALEKNPEFKDIRLRLSPPGTPPPRIGDNILYRVGDYDVYFIPVYTAGAGGVVTEMGTIAAVGATFTGKYYVGLGDSAEEAFKAFLASLAGVGAPPPPPVGKEQRRQNVIDLFEDEGILVVEPVEINPHVSFFEGNVSYVSEDQWDTTKSFVDSFIQNWAKDAGKVLMWSEDSKINFGILINVEGIVELHFITVLFT
ncbi:MAG: UPF0182 family protein [Nitrososphaerales archaeon]